MVIAIAHAPGRDGTKLQVVFPIYESRATDVPVTFWAWGSCTGPAIREVDAAAAIHFTGRQIWKWGGSAALVVLRVCTP